MKKRLLLKKIYGERFSNTFTKKTFGKRIKDIYPEVRHDNIRCWQYINVINNEKSDSNNSTSSLIQAGRSDKSVEEIQEKLVKPGESDTEGD